MPPAGITSQRYANIDNHLVILLLTHLEINAPFNASFSFFNFSISLIKFSIVCNLFVLVKRYHIPLSFFLNGPISLKLSLYLFIVSIKYSNDSIVKS